jgi:hypothetical protein
MIVGFLLEAVSILPSITAKVGRKAVKIAYTFDMA